MLKLQSGWSKYPGQALVRTGLLQELSSLPVFTYKHASVCVDICTHLAIHISVCNYVSLWL